MMKYIECKLLNNSDLNAINNGGENKEPSIQ